MSDAAASAPVAGASEFDFNQRVDLDAVMALEVECFESAMVESRDVFRERLEVFADGFICVPGCAYITGELWKTNGDAVDDDSRFAIGHSSRKMHTPAGDTLYVSAIAVSPNQRSKGLGARIMTELCERVKRQYPAVTQALLIVREDWPAAIRLYTKCGFVEQRRLRGFLDGRDAIIMRKTLA